MQILCVRIGISTGNLTFTSANWMAGNGVIQFTHSKVVLSSLGQLCGMAPGKHSGNGSLQSIPSTHYTAWTGKEINTDNVFVGERKKKSKFFQVHKKKKNYGLTGNRTIRSYLLNQCLSKKPKKAKMKARNTFFCNAERAREGVCISLACGLFKK